MLISYLQFLLLVINPIVENSLKEDCKGFNTYDSCELISKRREDRDTEQRITLRWSMRDRQSFSCIPDHLPKFKDIESYDYVLVYPEFYRDDGFISEANLEDVKKNIYFKSKHKVKITRYAKTSWSGIYKCLLIKEDKLIHEFSHYLSISDYAAVIQTETYISDVSSCTNFRLLQKTANILQKEYSRDLKEKIRKSFNIRVRVDCELNNMRMEDIIDDKKSTELEKNVIKYYNSVGLYIKRYSAKFHFDIWLVSFISSSCANCPESAAKKIYKKGSNLLKSNLKTYTKQIDKQFRNLYKSNTIKRLKRFCLPGYEPLNILNPNCLKTIRCLQLLRNKSQDVFLDRFCSKCLPGFYKPNDRMELCKKCPIGSFTDQLGSVICFNCPTGSTTLAVGSHSWKNCTREKDLGSELATVKYGYNAKLKCKLIDNFIQQSATRVEWLTLNPTQLVNKTRSSISQDGYLLLKSVDESHNDVYKCHRYGRIDGQSYVLTYRIALAVEVNIVKIVHQEWKWKIKFCQSYDDEFYAKLINSELCYQVKKTIKSDCLFNTTQTCKREEDDSLSELKYDYVVSIFITYRYNEYSKANLRKHLLILNEIRDIYLRKKGHYENMISTVIDLPYTVSKTCDRGYETNGQYCIPCLLGRFKPDQSTNRCRRCPKGYYQFKIGSTDCIRCPKGTTTVKVGSDRKSLCKADSYSYRTEIITRRGNLVLIRCRGESSTSRKKRYRWYFRYGETRITLFQQHFPTLRIDSAKKHHSGIYECVLKNIDEFGIVVEETYRTDLYVYIDQKKRIDCEIGMEYSEVLGGCLPCKLGYHSSNITKKCKPCDMYSYQDKIGMNFCYICPNNQITYQNGSKSKMECINEDNTTLTDSELSKLKSTAEKTSLELNSYKLRRNLVKDHVKTDDKSCKNITNLRDCKARERECSVTCPLQGFYVKEHSDRKCLYGDLEKGCNEKTVPFSKCYSKEIFSACCLTCLKKSESSGLPYSCRYGDKEDCESKDLSRDCILSYNFARKKCCNYCNKLRNRIETIWLGDSTKIGCIELRGELLKGDDYVWTSPDGLQIFNYEEDLNLDDLTGVALINSDGNLVIHRAKKHMTGVYKCQVQIEGKDRIINTQISITLLVISIPLSNILIIYEFKSMEKNASQDSVRNFLDSMREQACIRVRFQDFGKCSKRVVNVFSELNSFGKTLIVNLTLAPLNRYRSIINKTTDACDRSCREDLKNKLNKHVINLYQYFKTSDNFRQSLEKNKIFQLTKNEEKQDDFLFVCEDGYELIYETEGLACSPCKPGWYSKELNLCHPCSDGSYQPNYGSNFCYHCPIDEVTDRTGAINQDECHRF
ncbi:DgyrCDS5382 [Dimorphilus gyrociliatus]|uniref:DgyrCDS5382 n=1 Tax=Dimorphilus gyrociliatus TaxID=2664684 RepID=A0A7I8VJP9_9ANNE|nr:DgyrCDS5382 [Dimorphilus gyrociliatus]